MNVVLLSCERPLNFFESKHGAKLDPFQEDNAIIETLRAKGVNAERVPWNASGIDWADYDLGIISSTWDYFTQCEAFLSQIDRIGALVPLHNSPSTIRWNADKSYLLELEKKGIEIVPSQVLRKTSSKMIRQTARSAGWNEFIVKPLVGGGALQTHRLNTQDRDDGDLDLPTEAIVQPFVETIASEGEWSFIYFFGIYQYAILKKPAEGDFRVQTIHGGREVLAEPSETDRLQANAIAEATCKECLYARVDVVRAPTGKMWLMELELIEPFLYLPGNKAGLSAFTDQIVEKLKQL